MNVLIIKLAVIASKLLRVMEYLISWLSCKVEYILLRASLKLQSFALNKQRSRYERTKSRLTISRAVIPSQHTQRPRDQWLVGMMQVQSTKTVSHLPKQLSILLMLQALHNFIRLYRLGNAASLVFDHHVLQPPANKRAILHGSLPLCRLGDNSTSRGIASAVHPR